jgi:hypothetical protein
LSINIYRRRTGGKGLTVSRFDGSDEELTYAGALLEIAGRVAFPTQEHAAEVIVAIKKEHGIAVVLPEVSIAQQEAELDQLRAEKQRRADAAEIARLRAELAATAVPAPVDDQVDTVDV